LDQTIHDRTLALAGIFQAAHLVQQLANRGHADDDIFSSSINSVLKINASDTSDVFGGVQGVRIGLRLLQDKLDGETQPDDLEIAKYVIAMVQHAHKLGKQQELMEAIQKGMETILEQMEFFEKEKTDNHVHPMLVEKLAELYTQTISAISPRIIINGEEGYLSDPAIASKVRASLFAGIRAAFLWHQLGGRRWHLLFNRSKTVMAATDILTSNKIED
jgi:high frequency lysogenization protein